MICTFGDLTDVTWWRELELPARPIIDWDGRIKDEPPAAITDPAGRATYAELAGLTIRQAQRRIVELLGDAGELAGQPRPITHAVKFYEKGERPLEILTTRQWYLRNGGRDLALRAELLERGRALAWHPDHMRVRYESWVEGLNGDWLVSRQRFFGVPFPIWYPVDATGAADWDTPILAPEARLPVDPSSDVPDGYDAAQRGQPDGFVGDPDVMDTWATSSLTPQLACGWEDDPDLFARTFPMDLRPQGPEIIRTWLFDTVVRAHFEHGVLPWQHVTINGWVLDPDRKKMSKSKGNVITPMNLLEQYGSDAVRYWAASGHPGTDTALDEGQMKIGRRLAIKILNASKFALGVGGDADPTDRAAATEPVDRSLLATLAALVGDVTDGFADYDYARALDHTERFFWGFCDDYVELVKQRAYGTADAGGERSARVTLLAALETLLRLFAPHLPFVTEEVWSWWRPGSVHHAAWPEAAVLREAAADGDPAVIAVATEVLGAVRKAKTQQHRSLRSEVARVTVRDTAARLDALRPAVEDLRAAARVTGELVLVEGEPPGVEVELAPDPSGS